MRSRTGLGILVRVVVPVAMGLAVAAVARPAAQPSPAQLKAREEGRALFVEHCAGCHGAAARGNGPAADSLRQRPPDLTGYARQNGGVFPSERLRTIVDGRGVGAHGSVEMPVWGSVFKATAGSEQAVRDRIDAILAFLQSIQERAGEAR